MRDLQTTSNFANAPHPGRGKTRKPAWSNRIFGRLERAVFPLALFTSVMSLVYWYWTTTPQYALAAVVMSITNHDTQMFEKYVDVDTVSGRAFDEIVDGPARRMILGKYDQMIGAGFLRFFKNDAIGIAHEKAIDFVATNHSSVNIGAAGWLIAPYATLVPEQHLSLAPAEAATLAPDQKRSAESEEQYQNPKLSKHEHKTRKHLQLKDFGISKEGFQGYSFRQDGPVAILTLKFHSQTLNQDWIADVKFEDAGGYWRVTELANLHELIGRYLDLKAQKQV